MRKRLTDATWEGTPVVDGTKGLGWPALSDLAHEYAQLTGLPTEDARVLVDFASSGHPLEITWDQYLRDLGYWERNTAVAVVEYIHHDPGQDSPFRVRIRYPGFGHEVRSQQIAGVRCISTVMTFSTERGPMPARKIEEGSHA